MGIGGDFYAPEAKLIERYRMLDANTLDWTLTIDQPEGVHAPVDDDVRQAGDAGAAG